MSKTIGTPAQISALESAFDELALLKTSPLKDWHLFLFNAVGELERHLFDVRSITPTLSDPTSLMIRIVSLVRSEMEYEVKKYFYNFPECNKRFKAWWEECLSFALSIACREIKSGRKATIERLRDREFAALLCLAEIRHSVFYSDKEVIASSISEILQAFESYPHSWYSDFWQWSPSIIKKADSFLFIARSKLWLSSLEEAPLSFTLLEVFELTINVFGLLRSAELGEKADVIIVGECFYESKSDSELFYSLRFDKHLIKRRINRDVDTSAIRTPRQKSYFDVWVSEFHEQPHKKRAMPKRRPRGSCSISRAKIKAFLMDHK